MRNQCVYDYEYCKMPVRITIIGEWHPKYLHLKQMIILLSELVFAWLELLFSSGNGVLLP